MLISLLTKKVGESLTPLQLDSSDLDGMQKLVGGLIEPIRLHDKTVPFDVYVNEESKMMPDAKAHLRLPFADIIFGDVFFSGGVDDDGDTVGLSSQQVDAVRAWVARNDISGEEHDPEEYL